MLAGDERDVRRAAFVYELIYHRVASVCGDSSCEKYRYTWSTSSDDMRVMVFPLVLVV